MQIHPIIARVWTSRTWPCVSNHVAHPQRVPVCSRSSSSYTHLQFEFQFHKGAPRTTLAARPTEAMAVQKGQDAQELARPCRSHPTCAVLPHPSVSPAYSPVCMSACLPPLSARLLMPITRAVMRYDERAKDSRDQSLLNHGRTWLHTNMRSIHHLFLITACVALRASRSSACNVSPESSTGPYLNSNFGPSNVDRRNPLCDADASGLSPPTSVYRFRILQDSRPRLTTPSTHFLPRVSQQQFPGRLACIQSVGSLVAREGDWALFVLLAID